MRTILVVWALLWTAGRAAAQQKVDIHRSAISSVSVRLSGAVGSVRVIGWDRDSIAVVGTLGAGSRMDGGPFSASGPVSGLKFYVEAPDEGGVRSNRLELHVPRQARVWVKLGSADVDAAGVTGGLDLNVVGGSIRVNARSRELLVESMDGAVDVSGSFGYARLKTATGDITVRGAAEDLLAATVSGTIRVTDGEVERGRFETVTGPIVFAAALRRGGETRFDTHSGAIDLRLPRSASIELDAASVTGKIENAWSTTRPIIGREGRGMELGISSGMGATRVTIRSFKGNVRLAAK